MMPNLLSRLKKIFPSTGKFALSLALGLSCSAAIYLGLLQRHFFSYRYLVYAFVILIGATFIAAWLNQRYLRGFYSELPLKIRRFILASSLGLALALIPNTPIQPLYYALPDSQLEMQWTIPELPAGQEGVRLLWVQTGQGFVHYSRMAIEGHWERVFGNTIFSPGQQVRLAWTGKVGPQAEIAFRQTDFDQPVEIVWNGHSQTVNLKQPKEPNVLIRTRIDVPFIYQLPFILAFITSVGYSFFILLALLGGLRWQDKKRSRSHPWLLYALPMLIAWGLSLLVFWPGIMSTDALSQWGMGVTGEYNDWQSAFHALIIAGLMRIWYTPALVSLTQIVVFALAVAWGLGAFQERGAPPAAMWVISLLFAVFPSNLMLSVTLWKDVAYAIAFVWLTGVLVRIALSRGEWLKKPLNWAILVLSAFLTAVFRQNGAPVALITLLVLPFVFRRHWKTLAAGLLAVILLFILAKGPLYSAINLNRSTTGQENLIFLHHIAAHLDAGTPIEPPDRDYLDSLMPLEKWDYWCCYVGPISLSNQFDRSSFFAHTARNRSLALSLFAKNPWVDISHAACAGELAWKFGNNPCYTKSMHGVNTWRPGEVDWIGKNDYGLEDHSLLPGLVDPYIAFFRKFGFLDDKLVFYLLPAFWLHFGVFSVALACVRRRRLSIVTTLLPLIVQTVILILISFAPAYRYHFGTCLAGMLLLGMLFLPANEGPK